MSAQRLPASWNRSPLPAVQGHHRRRVLNAFRHHGIGHHPQSAGHGLTFVCSTPSGIMESVTSLKTDFVFAVNGAQRLPASWNRSPLGGSYLDAPLWCSTPSGIMESVTNMLGPVVIQSISAQRLPASWNRSPCCNCRNTDYRLVLNAFRHHGIGHQHLRRGGPGAGNVLNAFRHHGIGHFNCPPPTPTLRLGAQRLPASWNRSQAVLAMQYKKNMCSTPSGIMESVTAQRGPGGRLVRVLNAFRHHGIGHGTIEVGDKFLVTCSTPSGIMESVTRAMQRGP